jgi:phosphatidylinositol alpha-1,6-mannosyltransferase
VNTDAALRPLILTEVFPPPLAGGSEIFIYHLARRIAPENTLVLGPHTPGCDAFDREQPFSTHRLRHVRPSWQMGDVGTARQTFRFARVATDAGRSRAANIILVAQGYPTPITASVTSRRLNIPYTVLCHGEELFSMRTGRGVRAPFRRAILRRACRAAAAVFGPSRYARDEALLLGVAPERFHVVHPGVDLREIHPGQDGSPIRQRFHLGARPILLSCGRLHQKKGMRRMARLLPQIARHIPDVAYIVVGEGPDREVIESTARAGGVADRMIFAGLVPREELPAYYAAADVVVMAYQQEEVSDTEGFGIVLAEAGAAGKPAVAAEIGGTGDAIVDGETGFLLREGDDGGLVNALVTLFKDPALRARMGAAGRARVERELNWDAAAAKVREVLTSVVERHEWSRRRR